MPRIVRFLGINCVIGFVLGVVVGVTIVSTNIGGLRELLATSPDQIVATIALLFFCGLTFAALTMAGAVMALPYKDDQG
jgi:hypothetical protein